MGEQGFKGGTRGATEWNQWIESEKQSLAKVMEQHGIHWKQLGTHNKHLSVLDYQKQERGKELAKVEIAIDDNRDTLADTLCQQTMVKDKIEQIKRKEAEIRKENDLLVEENDDLLEVKEKLLSDNLLLEKKQLKLQNEINEIMDSKAVMEGSISTYDKDEKWQLPEPGAFVSAKAYRDNKAKPLVEKLTEIVKSLTIKCINLMKEITRLREKTANQEFQISRMTDKLLEQTFTVENLQEKVEDFERLQRFVGKNELDSIMASARELEWFEEGQNQSEENFNMSQYER